MRDAEMDVFSIAVPVRLDTRSGDVITMAAKGTTMLTAAHFG